MVSAISTALGGYDAAITRLDVAAGNIANPSGAQGTGQAREADPARQLIGATVASYDAQANLKTIKAQDELFQQALNIVS
jgi:flagellar hook protein FlgE